MGAPTKQDIRRGELSNDWFKVKELVESTKNKQTKLALSRLEQILNEALGSLHR